MLGFVKGRQGGRSARDAGIDLASWFRSTARPGDLVLTGCSDPTSRLIQFVTGSEVSHVAIVTGDESVVEAYDYGFTPLELDEGIYETPFEVFLGRTTLDRIMVRRPVGLDVDTLASAIRFALDNSPPFPTAGATLTSLLIATGKPGAQRIIDGLYAVGLGSPIDRALDGLVDFVADGPERVHCSEIATRLYLGADLHLRFVQPVLAAHMGRVLGAVRDGGVVRIDRRKRGKIASLDRHFRRRARPGDRVAIDLGGGPKELVDSKVSATTEMGKMVGGAFRARLDDIDEHEPDVADLILPADFERAEPFDTVGLVVRRRGRWQHGEIVLRLAGGRTSDAFTGS